MLGDNLSNSTDSRTYGAVPLGLVKSRAVAKVWPPHEAGIMQQFVPALPTVSTPPRSDALARLLFPAIRDRSLNSRVLTCSTSQIKKEEDRPPAIATVARTAAETKKEARRNTSIVKQKEGGTSMIESTESAGGERRGAQPRHLSTSGGPTTSTVL